MDFNSISLILMIMSKNPALLQKVLKDWQRLPERQELYQGHVATISVIILLLFFPVFPSIVYFSHRGSSSTEGCLPPKVVFHRRSSSHRRSSFTKGRLPTEGRLPTKVVFQRRSSSNEGCHSASNSGV